MSPVPLGPPPEAGAAGAGAGGAGAGVAAAGGAAGGVDATAATGGGADEAGAAEEEVAFADEIKEENPDGNSKNAAADLVGPASVYTVVVVHSVTTTSSRTMLRFSLTGAGAARAAPKRRAETNVAFILDMIFWLRA